MKILLFNRYVKRLEVAEKPDIIILGVPGAVQNLSEKFTMGFAVTPYLTFNAVLVDYLILCSFFEISEDFFCKISTMCEYKFGCPVDCFHISDVIVDMMSSEEKKIIITKVLNRDFTKQKLAELKDAEIQKFNILEPKNEVRLFDLITEKIAADFTVMRRDDI